MLAQYLLKKHSHLLFFHCSLMPPAVEAARCGKNTITKLFSDLNTFIQSPLHPAQWELSPTKKNCENPLPSVHHCPSFLFSFPKVKEYCWPSELCVRLSGISTHTDTLIKKTEQLFHSHILSTSSLLLPHKLTTTLFVLTQWYVQVWRRLSYSI